MTSFLKTDGKALNDNDTMTGSVYLANAKLVLHDQIVTGSVNITDGKIVEITEGDAVPSGSINCQQDYVIPGLVELHTDNVERHIEPRPEVYWPHLPALIAHDAQLASTGITTVFDALRLGTRSSNKSNPDGAYARQLADVLLDARENGVFKISHFIHLRAEICSETLLEELASFGPEDRIGIVSLMDHTPGQRQFRDLAALRVYTTKKRNLNDDEFADYIANLKTLQKAHGAAHEKGAVEAAKRYGAVLASHDDTTTEQVLTSKKNGVQFAEFPTTVEAADACRSHGMAVMMGAPNIIRGGSHSGNVSAAELAQENLLDILSSDYAPAALLVAAFQLEKTWNDLPRAINTVTQNPATAVGLSDRGRLEVGMRGDVARVTLHNTIPLLRGAWSLGNRAS